MNKEEIKKISFDFTTSEVDRIKLETRIFDLFKVNGSEKTLAEEFKEYTDDLLKSEKDIRQFLIDAGINDKNGDLTERYTNKILYPVVFGDREYFGISEFNCINVGLYTEKTLQGTFFTHIPISDKEYRMKNTTKAKVEIENENEWTIFKIYCDWGVCHIMKIHNTLKKEIEIAKQNAIDELLYIVEE